MKTLEKIEIEAEHSGRKKMVNSRGTGVIQDTVMANSGEFEGEKHKETAISGLEEREEESNNCIPGENDREAKKRKKVKKGKEMLKDNTKDHNNEMPKDGVNGEGTKARRKETTSDVMRSATEERKSEKKRKNKKDDELVGRENGGEVKKPKRGEKDHMKLFNGKETKVESKKTEDDRKAHSKEKKRKMKVKEVDENCQVLKSKKRKRDSSKLVTPESDESRGVRLSEDVKGLPPFDDGGLVQGKRFSNEEDELIRKAVDRYIEAMQLGEEGLDMILECRSHPEVKDCWQVISTALPWRPPSSVYRRARKLFIRGDSKWTAEEVEFVRESYKKHGPNWKMMADKLGKYHMHVRNAFQRYKLVDLNKGKWSQDEYRRLFELVNEDLLAKVSEEKRSKYGMLKDNIRWEAISDELGTRDNAKCCIKWYNQLTSPMVAQGEWADVDDYRMLTALVGLDASCEEEVEWDDLLGHRSGELCRKRWLQMSRHLGVHGNKSFSEQVDVLSKRYCPDFAQVREVLDARPVVD